MQFPSGSIGKSTQLLRLTERKQEAEDEKKIEGMSRNWICRVCHNDECLLLALLVGMLPGAVAGPGRRLLSRDPRRTCLPKSRIRVELPQNVTVAVPGNRQSKAAAGPAKN